MKILSLRILLVMSLLLGFGTAGSVGAEAAIANAPGNVKIEQWTGHSFTFLALTADSQSNGYEIFAVDQATQGYQGDRSVRIPYAEHVGKQVAVTEIVPFDVGYNQKEYMVYMTVNDTGEKLVGRSMRGQIEGLVLTADLQSARDQFLGKKVYPKFRSLTGITAPSGDVLPTASTVIGGPVTVIDVQLGNQSEKPICLIVSVNGEKAILPMAYSWTNIQTQAWAQTPPWQDALFIEDPRNSLGWSPSSWSKIENGDIVEGMTKDQVELSWGKPYRTEANGSVWIYYQTKKLSFSGDVLHTIDSL